MNKQFDQWIEHLKKGLHLTRYVGEYEFQFYNDTPTGITTEVANALLEYSKFLHQPTDCGPGCEKIVYRPWRIVKIPKGKGRFRTIYIPDEDLKATCLKCMTQISDLAAKADKHNVQHGFTAGRSPVTNALCHVGWEYTMSFDLEDFFDTVTIDKLDRFNVSHGLGMNIGNWMKLMPEGAARQGLPTSPAIANLIASDMDNEIIKTLQSRGRMLNLVYTRYADDLTFSFNNPDMIKTLSIKVPEIVARHGFKINPRKTKTQWAGAGNRMVTGVAVGKTGISAPRSIRRRLRAARHQIQKGAHGRTLTKLVKLQDQAKRNHRVVSINGLMVGCYNGLNQWARLVVPKAWADRNKSKTKTVVHTAKQVAASVINFTLSTGRKI